MGKRAVSSFVRPHIVALHDAEFNQVQISKQLHNSRYCVQNAINQYEHLGTYEDLKPSGRTKILDGWGFQHLERLVKGDTCLTATRIASDLNASLPRPVTTQTVGTHLKDPDFEYMVKVKKQWLGIQHRQQRFARYTKYMNWTSDDWKHMIFFG